MAAVAITQARRQAQSTSIVELIPTNPGWHGRLLQLLQSGLDSTESQEERRLITDFNPHIEYENIFRLFAMRKFDFTTTVSTFFRWAPSKVTKSLDESNRLFKACGVVGYSFVSIVTTVLTPVATISLAYDAIDYRVHKKTPNGQQCLCARCIDKETELFNTIKLRARSQGTEKTVLRIIQACDKAKSLRNNYYFEARLREGSANFDARIEAEEKQRVDETLAKFSI